jgi:hypothetical protein
MQKRTSKMLKRCFHGLMVAVAACTTATAQTSADSTLKPVVVPLVDTAAAKVPDTYFQTRHWAIGLSAGSNALFGFDVACSVHPLFNVRFGYNYLDLSYKDLTPILKAVELPAELGGEVMMAQSHLTLTAEFTPTRSKIWRLAVGGVFFPKNEISGTVFYTRDLALNDLVISASEVGSMKGTYTTASKIAPYIGIGLGRTVPKKRVGLNVDLGGIYKGEPQLDIQATGLLKGNESNEAILNRNFKPLTWYPVAQLRLAIKLN